MDFELSAIVAGSPDEVSEVDHLSDWGNDAAVYSSDSELSDWEEPRDTYAAYTDSQSHSQAVEQAAAGKTSLTRQTSGHTHAELAGYHQPLLSTFACTIIILHHSLSKSCLVSLHPHHYCFYHRC